jgi:hypothetical protein
MQTSAALRTSEDLSQELSNMVQELIEFHNDTDQEEKQE